MAEPIYKVYLNRFTEEFYRLTEEERESLRVKIREMFEETGSEGVIRCDSGWASEQWDFWGVSKHPDIDAVRKLRQLQDEVGWFKYVESVSVLGTKRG